MGRVQSPTDSILKNLPNYGKRTAVKIKVYQINPMRPEILASFRQFRSDWSCDVTFRCIGGFKVKTDDICTQQRLVHLVRQYFGFGRFAVFFVDNYKQNKKFRPEFRCTAFVKNKCYFQSWCKKSLDKYEIGFGCWNNPRRMRAYTAMAYFTIKELMGGYGKDYAFVWHKYLKGCLKDKMSRFWFWKGDVPGSCDASYEGISITDMPAMTDIAKDYVPDLSIPNPNAITDDVESLNEFSYDD